MAEPKCTTLSRRHNVRSKLGELEVMEIADQYQVCFDQPVPGAAALTASKGNVSIPAYRSSYPDSEFADCVVVGKSCEPQDISGRNYIVTVNYKTYDLMSGISSPLAMPTEYSFGVEEEVIDVFTDYNGKRIVASNGETFEHMPKRRSSKPTITIVRSEASYDPTNSNRYLWTTNKGAVQIDGISYTPDSLLLRRLAAQKIIQGKVTYYRVTRELLHDYIYNHQVFIKDMGTQQLVGGKWQPILDSCHRPVTRPVPLSVGVPKANVTDDPDNKFFTIYASQDWSAMHLERTNLLPVQVTTQ